MTLRDASSGTEREEAAVAWIREADEDEPTGAVAEAYGREVAARGYVPNYAKVLALRPEALAAWAGLSGAVRSGMGLRRYELATLAAALRLRSTYCSVAHASVLQEKVGLDAGTLRDAASGSRPEALTPAEHAIMRLADRVAAGAADMTEDDLAEARAAGLDDVEILDVVLAAAARCFFSTTLDALGIRADAAYAELDPELRAALTVGRPIEGTGDEPVRG